MHTYRLYAHIDKTVCILMHTYIYKQVHFLGFPSTLGATYIDYIIGDAHVTPPDLSTYYTEKLMLLPHTFQVTSHKYRQKHPLSDARDADAVLNEDTRIGYGFILNEWMYFE